MECHLLSHGISVEKKALHDCCLMRGSALYGNPHIIDLDENNLVNWEKFFELKRNLKDIKAEKTEDCKGCRELTEESICPDGDYIAFINLNHWNICNSKCIYCTGYYNGGDKYFNVLPLIKSLMEYGNGNYLRNYGEVTFQGGEPTILPEFEELLNLFIQINIPIRIHSSGIKYSQAIADGIQKGLVTVVISPDSGTKEIYETVKRVPCFDKVWNNLKEYASYQKENKDRVKAKFIIIPGINDTVEEIDKFIEKVMEAGLSNVIWEVEGCYASREQYNVPHICILVDYAMEQARKYGLKDEFYDSCIYSMKNRTISKIENIDRSEFIAKYNNIKSEYKEKYEKYVQDLLNKE